MLNSFIASDDFCRLLLTFANSLDPDQDQLDIGPDLDPNWLTSERILFEKANFEKKSADDNKSMKNYPACKELSSETYPFSEFFMMAFLL